MKFIIIVFLFTLLDGLHYKVNVLKSAILNFAPNLRLHHIVSITDKRLRTYSIDFSPINQSHPTTLLKLAFGHNVPAETRIRQIVYSENESQLLENWIIENDKIKSIADSERKSMQVLCSIKDRELKEKLLYLRSWKNTMNLYTGNCQHFSKYAVKNLK
jgi:hypothetical protein